MINDTRIGPDGDEAITVVFFVRIFEFSLSNIVPPGVFPDKVWIRACRSVANSVRFNSFIIPEIERETVLMASAYPTRTHLTTVG